MRLVFKILAYLISAVVFVGVALKLADDVTRDYRAWQAEQARKPR